MMKYVILNEAYPVILPEGVEHKEAESLMIGGILRVPAKATSAGFFFASGEGENIRIHIFGESGSLGIGPGPDDANLIKKLLRGTT